MKVIVIFTYGISLKHWVDSGIYDREMLLYQGLEKEHGIEFTFITFGVFSNNCDCDRRKNNGRKSF